MNSELKGPIEYIKEAWVIYTKKENFIFFAKIMGVLVLLSSSVGYISSYFYPVDYFQNIDFSNVPTVVGFLVVSILATLLSIWSQTTQYFAILKMGDSEKEVFKIGYKKILRFIVISFTVGIIVAFGAILLIIPAIIFGVWYSFSTWLVLDKEMSVFHALKVSRQMVAGKFFKILGRSVVFGLFAFVSSILLSIIPYVGTVVLSFITPIFLLPMYLLYKDLSATI